MAKKKGIDHNDLLDAIFGTKNHKAELTEDDHFWGVESCWSCIKIVIHIE